MATIGHNGQARVGYHFVKVPSDGRVYPAIALAPDHVDRHLDQGIKLLQMNRVIVIELLISAYIGALPCLRFPRAKIWVEVLARRAFVNGGI